MALITSDCDAIRIHEHQMAVITSECDLDQGGVSAFAIGVIRTTRQRDTRPLVLLISLKKTVRGHRVAQSSAGS